jgi:hypothetical protein
MKEAIKKHAKKLLAVTECDLKSAQRILGLSDGEIMDKLPGRIDHITTNMQEVLNLMTIEKVNQPDLFEHACPIILDGDEYVQGRVVYIPDGVEPEQEDDGE